MKFNKNTVASLLNADDFKRNFEKYFEETNQGWAIYWNGARMKPLTGKNDTFASYDAALKALERNMPSFSAEIKRIVFESMIGKKVDSKVYLTETEEYKAHFRTDLAWEDVYDHLGKLRSRRYREENTLTPEELVIRKECAKEEDAFDKFCRHAMMNIFVPQWMNDGTLQIKKI